MIASAWPSCGSYRLADGTEIALVRESIPFKPAASGAIAIERPVDPAYLIQDWCHRSDLSVSIPYWAEVWPSARAIANRLAAGPVREGTSVLDLGCGLGLAGIAAGLRGASVTFVDHNEDALHFARRNALAAGLTQAEFRAADWHRDSQWKPFDLVLGADVIYDRSDHEAIEGLLVTLLACGGVAWLGDPCREGAVRFMRDWSAIDGRSAVTLGRETIPGVEVEIAIHELRRG